MIGMTLSRHILEQGESYPEARGELSIILTQIAFVAKILGHELRRAALVGKLGLIGSRNLTGDAQKKLDIFANDTFLQAFGQNDLVAAMVSEELDEPKVISCGDNARYILCTDPLDGSSNTDVNGSLGTIFGIYRRTRTGHCADMDEILRKGSEMVAAGYVFYGTSTLLVFSSGHGVNGFTLDQNVGEFILSHENVGCPQRGNSFSANVGRIGEWSPGVRAFVEHLTSRDTNAGKPYSLRYSGALVADVHRSLSEGGSISILPTKATKAASCGCYTSVPRWPTLSSGPVAARVRERNAFLISSRNRFTNACPSSSAARPMWHFTRDSLARQAERERDC